MSEFQQNLSQKDLKELFDLFDLDKSGKVSILEFEIMVFNSDFGDLKDNKILN